MLDNGAEVSARRTIFTLGSIVVAEDGRSWKAPERPISEGVSGQSFVDDLRADLKSYASTPLEVAVMNGSVQIISALIDHGADPNLASESSIFSGPLEMAYVLVPSHPSCGQAIVDLLIARGADDACIKNNARLEGMRRLVEEEKQEQERKQEESTRNREEAQVKQEEECEEYLQPIEKEWRKGLLRWVP